MSLICRGRYRSSVFTHGVVGGNGSVRRRAERWKSPSTEGDQSFYVPVSGISLHVSLRTLRNPSSSWSLALAARTIRLHLVSSPFSQEPSGVFVGPAKAKGLSLYTTNGIPPGFFLGPRAAARPRDLADLWPWPWVRSSRVVCLAILPCFSLGFPGLVWSGSVSGRRLL